MKESSFTENPGTDWVALDSNGNVVARAASKEAVTRAAPNAAGHRRIEEDRGWHVSDVKPKVKTKAEKNKK